jgi:uncharacterized protein
MVCWHPHAAYYRETPRRPRRSAPPRGWASRRDDRRCHPHCARAAPRGRRAPTPRGCRQRAQRTQRRLGADRGDSRLGDRPIALIVDAGPLYAYVDADDDHHSPCLELLESHSGPLVVPTLVITEVAYLIETRLGWEAEVRFLGDLASGSFAVEPLHASDPIRIAELVAEYRDLPLGTVDASVIATAERLDATEVATLDRRHFSVVRPRHEVAFQLLPWLHLPAAAVPLPPEATMTSMSATSATEITAARHQIGNGKSFFSLSARMNAAEPASCLFPDTEMMPKNQSHGHFTEAFGSTEPYRYGDSNPGFRTENPAS